jgi:hypothetical protein
MLPLFFKRKYVELIQPISYLLGLTLFSMVIMLVSRIKAVRTGAVKPGYFRIYQNTSSTAVPKEMIRINRHFQNLLEMPLIFYFICLLAMHLNFTKDVEIWAWLFVFARLSQSVIHLTVNHIMMRMLSFALGIIGLIGMWLTIIGKIYL